MACKPQASHRQQGGLLQDFGGLNHETNPLLPLPLVGVEPVGQFHPRGQRVNTVEPDAVHRLALVLELERQVFFAHQAL